MAGRTSQVEQVAAISRATQVGSHAELFREHLADIVASPAFRGSRRSQEFLQHIVDKALTGQFEDLKERAIGVELFGRAATYDTGGDAIVRVTASDVRRRLLHCYSEFCVTSDVRIELPAGSYIPEFRQLAKAVPETQTLAPTVHEETTTQQIVAPASRRPGAVVVAVAAVLGVLALATVAIGLRNRAATQPVGAAAHMEPWSSLLRPDHQTRLILCDPDISKIQGLLNFRISLSDYANHQYVPAGVAAAPEMQRAIQTLRGVDVAAIDTSIALNISELALQRSRHVRTQTARSMQLSDFKVDDDFVLLGSPRSNPWFALFADRLDFRFEYDLGLKQEVIRNSNVRAGESAMYVPTAQGWETGHAYAIIGFVRNPGQNGHVLLLAGSNAEATEAAGKLVTNVDLLSQILKKNGIDPSGSPQAFEILLRASTMAGSSNTFEVVAFHKLAEGVS